ncbi:thioredoxin reductase TrxB2_2 [Mycobacterium marinum M]|uniref:Thioredoxin reductase TrxB2_2 n=1 Tax=Mycobacterium marinum (strain ATCC BAA-535 / M) TaxID=216594 RepID=B2HKT0_MYCMM|nr:NAD(P)/FAD-dependent oxidoreductase [Mycobacterium marinum]ACC40351.1 thioredoxin reductase TrxB2_2 [Mycobacterium marinum M]
MTDPHDVVVIGSGPAGLSSALTLARARRSVLVIDGGQPRNARSAGVHDFLTRDGCAPADLISAGHTEIAGYGGQLRQGQVVAAHRNGSMFEVSITDGSTIRARKLLIASGLVDHLPDITGLAELWGTDVLYCPYCHGWEVRDQPIGVLATGPESVHQALMFRQWSPRITLFLNGAVDPSEPERARLHARQIEVIISPVTEVVSNDGRLEAVALADGNRVALAALALLPRMVANTDFLDPLGLRLVAHPSGFGENLQTDGSGRTSVPGVYAAGNAADISAHVVNSASSGLLAAMAINADLVDEDTEQALLAVADR